ncbi:hypothetical protein GSH19_05435 [Lactobacillus sp. S2-2]|uniref:hypothetical protein n=1 Tax=Lactobacillus sp. S2-2 TaxID=2692917 RepID=UPI001F3AE1FF|nr:hypothetical protein [Lactobacillus sp. S2-2]MCF6515595.1 hypothetical protein [Lactobacillus sp. S2-2]
MNYKIFNKLILLIIASCSLLIFSNQTVNASKTTVSNYYISINGKEFLKSLKSNYPKSYKRISKTDYRHLNNKKKAVKLSKVNSNYRMVLNYKVGNLISKINMVAISGSVSDGLMHFNKLKKEWSAPVNFGTAFSVIHANDVNLNNKNIAVSYKAIPKHKSSYVITSFK